MNLKIETNTFDNSSEIAVLENGVILNEYTATPLKEQIPTESDVDIEDKKNPFMDSIEKFSKTLQIKEQKTICNIAFELLDNIYKYRITDPNITIKESAYVKAEGNFVYIGTSNTITAENKKLLESKLKGLNTMASQEGGETELKKIYQNVLSNNKMNKQGGAGLGLLGIIKRRLTPFKYKFIPIDNNGQALYQFHLETQITTTPKIQKTTFIKTRTQQGVNNTLLTH